MATNLPTREDCLDHLIPVNIANLPGTSTIGDPTCQICLGNLADNATPGESERAVTLHDSHYFGEDCIRHWLEQNDSCPLCREKVQKGSPHDNRLAIDLLTAMAQMIRQDPSIESPIDDRALLSLFGQMRRAAETIASDSVRGLLEDASCRLLRWRRDWWLKNTAFLQMGEFASHTSSNALRAEAHDTTIVVRAEQSCLLILQQVNDGYDQAIGNVSLGQPAHVATHPLSFVVSRVLRKQLTANDGKSMSVKELGFRLHNAVKQDQYLQDLAVALGKERPEALRFLTAWMDDVLIRVLQDLIWSSSQ